MGKSAQISKTIKNHIILLKEEGYKNVQIASRLNLSTASVCRILKRYKESISLSPIKRSGRPRKTTPRTDRTIRRLWQVNPSISSLEIKRSVPKLADVSPRIILYRLNKDMKLPACKSLKKPLLTPKRKDSISATSTKIGRVKIGRKLCSLMSQPFCSLAPIDPTSEDCRLLTVPYSKEPSVDPRNCQAPSVCHSLGVLFQPKPRASISYLKVKR